MQVRKFSPPGFVVKEVTFPPPLILFVKERGASLLMMSLNGKVAPMVAPMMLTVLPFEPLGIPALLFSLGSDPVIFLVGLPLKDPAIIDSDSESDSESEVFEVPAGVEEDLGRFSTSRSSPGWSPSPSMG